MLIACVCNPIFINTFVVFLRLYWFEKRFQSVVLDARQARRTRQRSRSKTEGPDEEHNAGLAEKRGVGDRKITVVRPESRAEVASDDAKGGDTSSETGSSDKKTDINPDDIDKVDKRLLDELSPTAGLPRAITFADEVRDSPTHPSRDTNADARPTPRSKEDSIAFVHKQNNLKDEDILYIPGPRDFDRGAVPQHVKIATNEQDLLRSTTTKESFPRIPENPRSAVEARFEINGDDHPMQHPERTKTSTSDSGVIVGSAARHRLAERVKGHLPFPNHHKDADAESTAHSAPTRRDSESPEGLRRRDRTRTFASFLTTSKTEPRDPMPYLTYQPTMGRNSNFVNLTEEQREELGGIEYRALKLLAIVLCVYYVGFHIFAMLSYLPWITNSSSYYKGVLDQDGINYGWWGVFTASSMYTDLGFTLTPDSMVSFGDAVWILLCGSFLIIIGNTGFPCMLRFVIWATSKVTPQRWPMCQELQFLLDHPRRCFTLLFPSKATWWLFWILVMLNVIDLVFFVILDLHSEAVESLSGGLKFLQGLFQAASTRTAGFAVVSLSSLHPAIQVSYLIMMYISVFPIAISVRRTNVYEEKSLGVYANNAVPEDEDHSYVGAHLRRQLSFDLWYVFLGLFIISIVEGDRIQNTNDYAFTMFSILFEIVSAYGTVGLSLGYPNTDPSFSSQFRVISKLIIIAMQIRGRHRGLPYALDKAIMLPSESLQAKEHEEATRRQLARKRGSISAGVTNEKGEPVGLDAVDELRGGMLHQRTMTDRSVGTGTVRHRGYSLGRLLSNAIGVGPSMSRKER